MLYDDGALFGFKTKPELGQPFPDPLNDFIVKGVQVNESIWIGKSL